MSLASFSIHSQSFPASVVRAISYSGKPALKDENHLDYKEIEKQYLKHGLIWQSLFVIKKLSDGPLSIGSNSAFSGDIYHNDINNGFDLTQHIVQGIIPTNATNYASVEFLVRICLSRIIPPMADGLGTAFENLLKKSNNQTAIQENNLIHCRTIEFSLQPDGSVKVSAIFRLKEEQMGGDNSPSAADDILIMHDFTMHPDPKWGEEQNDRMTISRDKVDFTIPEKFKASLGQSVEGWLAQVREWLVNFFAGLPGIGYERVAIEPGRNNNAYSLMHVGRQPTIPVIGLPPLGRVQNNFQGRLDMLAQHGGAKGAGELVNVASQTDFNEWEKKVDLHLTNHDRAIRNMEPIVCEIMEKNAKLIDALKLVSTKSSVGEPVPAGPGSANGVRQWFSGLMNLKS